MLLFLFDARDGRKSFYTGLIFIVDIEMKQIEKLSLYKKIHNRNLDITSYIVDTDHLLITGQLKRKKLNNCLCAIWGNNRTQYFPSYGDSTPGQDIRIKKLSIYM